MKRNNNKWLFFSCILFMLCAGIPFDVCSRTEVSSFGELQKAVKAGEKNIVLTADITITSALAYATGTVIDGQNLYSISYDDSTKTQNSFSVISNRTVSLKDIKEIIAHNSEKNSFSRFVATKISGDIVAGKISGHRFYDNNQIGDAQNGGGFIQRLDGGLYVGEVSDNVLEIINHKYNSKGYGGFINNPSGTISIEELWGNGIRIQNTNVSNLSFGGVINSYRNSTFVLSNAHDNFIENQSETGNVTSMGGVFFHDSATLMLKNSSFYANYVKSISNEGASIAQGGAFGIYDNGVLVFDNDESYVPNYKNNYALASSSIKAEALGGAIYIGCDGCGDKVAEVRNTINGTFEGNRAIATNASDLLEDSYHVAEGGAIYSKGIVDSILGTFKDNWVSSLDVAKGGAIANDGSVSNGIVNSKFINNGAIAGDVAKGGAIYTSSDLSIIADGDSGDGVSTFQGNYIQKDGENKIYQAIYVDDASSTLTFEAKNGGTINLYDLVDGEAGYNVVLTGDDTGTINLYNNLNNAKVTVNDVVLNMANGEVYDYKFDSLSSGNDVVYSIDIDAISGTSDTIETVGASSGYVTIDAINFIGSPTIIDKDFKVQIIKTQDDNLQLATLANELWDKEYLIEVISASVVDEEINANNLWNKAYMSTVTADGLVYGKLQLDTTDTLNDSISIKESSKVGGTTTTISQGDTLKLVNQDQSNEFKSFNAVEDGDVYVVRDNLGLTQGTLDINGVSGGVFETIDLNNKTGFEVGSGSILNLNDIRLMGGNGDVVDVLGGILNVSNSEVVGDIVNTNQINMEDSYINGKIENFGILNINGKSNISSILGDGITNINADFRLDGSIEGNTVNVNNASLSGINNLKSDVKLNAFGSIIDLDNNTANIKSVSFDKNSTLSLSVNSATDYGKLFAENITVENGAKLNASLAQGVVTTGEKITLQLLSANNTDFNNFSDVFDNEMYKFEKVDKNGLYSISLVKTAEDIVIEQGGEKWVSDVAKKYIDIGEFMQGSVAETIANKMIDLAQNDSEKIISEIKSIAPAEVSIGYSRSVENNDRLVKTINNYLRGEKNPFGMSSGDEISNASLWVRPYVSKSQMNDGDKYLETDVNSTGVIVGLEKKVDTNVKLGAGFQFEEGDISAYNRNIETLTTIGFIYGEYKPSDWFINSLVSYGVSKYDETKYALGAEFVADYDINFSSVSAITGYKFGNITPEIGLNYYHIKQNEYTDSAMQKVAENSIDMLRATGGVRLENNYKSFNSSVYLGLTYDLATDNTDTIVDLISGTSYVVAGKSMPRLGYELNVGVNTVVSENTAVYVSYMGAYNSDYQKHTGLLELRYNF